MLSFQGRKPYCPCRNVLQAAAPNLKYSKYLLLLPGTPELTAIQTRTACLFHVTLGRIILFRLRTLHASMASLSSLDGWGLPSFPDKFQLPEHIKSSLEHTGRICPHVSLLPRSPQPSSLFLGPLVPSCIIGHAVLTNTLWTKEWSLCWERACSHPSYISITDG